jgi:hypothetical protein
VVVLLSLQLGLGYLQGALLHRQHVELMSLRADIQDLAEALDQDSNSSEAGDSRGWRPGRRSLPGHSAPSFQKSGLLVLDPGVDDEDKFEEKTRKEMKEVQESNKKAVADARKVQSQLSISENARKAEEKAKMDAAQSQWQKWSMVALGVVALAFVLRAWWRRRG